VKRAHGTVPAPASATPVPHGRLPDGRYAPGYLQPQVSNTRIVARVPDPAGGPDWALRLADVVHRRVERPSRSLAGTKISGRARCVQLGRMQGETFGWVYGAGGFRPLVHDDQLALCHSPKREEPYARMVAALAIGADPSAPRVTANAIYGFVPGAKAAAVTGTEGADGPAEGADGAFLRVVGRQARQRPGAKLGDVPLLAGRPIPAERAHRYPHMLPETEVLEAPAPDPAGGPSWAIQVVQSREGRPCVGSPVQVVEGRGGSVDLERALFSPWSLPQSTCRRLDAELHGPCDFSGGGYSSGYKATDPFLARAAIERRVFAGRWVLRGECREDVERVTIATPRDTRTLVPSAVGHAIVAVYESGGYVDGNMVFTMHLRGGRTVSGEFPFAFG
jgi:hypothetical protein